MSVESSCELARMMRGRVPEWGDDYLERFIPKDILNRMFVELQWVDEDGFWWGFPSVSAIKLPSSDGTDNQEPVVVLASKPLGQGVHELKVIDTSGCIRTYGPTE